MGITVRRIENHEGPVLRDLRLTALLDSPSAFASTHAREAALADTFWAGRAAEGSVGSDRVTFFAFDGGTPDPIGLVAAFRSDADVVELVSMWTAPAARGRGVGAALVAAVVDFAHPAEVQLWVTRDNDPAQRLYERCGFEVTGEVTPLPSDPCKDEVRMRHCPR